MIMKPITFSLAAYMACASSISMAQCGVPTMSWKWYSNTAYMVDLSSGPLPAPENYTTAFQSIIPTFLATDLDEDLARVPGVGEVRLYNQAFGYLAVKAFVRAWYDSLECTDWTGLQSNDDNGCGGLPANRARV